MALLSLADTLGRRARWLLDLEVGGRVFRFSDEAVTVTDADGRTYAYREGLEPLSVEPSELGADASISISISSGDDWAELRARGHQLEARPGTLRRWFEGQILEDASIVLRGLTSEVVFASASEPLEFALARSMRVQSRVVPSPQMVVDEVTWPDAAPYARDDSIDGSYYPIIIGHPGRGGGLTKATSPALLVRVSTVVGDDDDWLIIAGHRVAATQVRIWDYTDKPASSELMTVYHEVDGLGRTVAVVKPGAGTALTIAPGRKYYAGWKITPGGGMIDPRTGTTLRGAGSVIRHMLETYTDVRIDSGRLAVEVERMDAIKIDTFFNTPVRVEDWLRSEVLPLLPVIPIEGEQGLYYRWMDWASTARDVKAYLSADVGHIERTSPVRAAGFSIANQIAIQYRHDRVSGRYRTRSVISADGDVVEGDIGQTSAVRDTRSLASYRCAVSRSRLATADGDDGVRPMEIATSSLWDRASAITVLQWLAARHALPKGVVEYDAAPEWEWLPVGSVVALTDSELHLSDALAMITKRTVGDGAVGLQFTLLDDPAASDRLTG